MLADREPVLPFPSHPRPARRLCERSGSLPKEVEQVAMRPLGADEQTTILAALLHDIGKFAQRARVPLGEGYRHFDRTVYGEHGAHALHSAQFVEQELAADFRSAIAAILYHHNPQDTLARIVAAADRYAAAERHADRAVEDALFQPLANVLAMVFADGPGKDAASGFFALHRLDPSGAEAFFPRQTVPDARVQEREYRTLWEDFVAAHRRLAQSDFSTYLVGLYSLLHQYTWCVPSAAFRSIPDISLFDHARTAAAIAAALYAFLADQGRLADGDDPLALGEETCFRLVVGDLSGIQAYLYDITHAAGGGVARRLRARSLYLQLITEVAAHQILAAAGLPFLNALMVSGGRFHLLLPNTPRAEESVARVQEQADRWLLREFGGELAFNLASVAFSATEFETSRAQSGFGTVLERAGTVLAGRKQTRLGEALQAGGQWNEGAFVLDGFGGASACPGCGKHPRSPEADLCTHCATDWQVGRMLPAAAYLALYSSASPGAIPVLGHSVSAVPRGGQIEGRPYLVLGLGDFDARVASELPLLARQACNYVPTWSDEDLVRRPPVEQHGAHSNAPVSFEDLARRARGRPLLGFLRADVDHLGEAFLFGLKPGRDTPSRLAQMSRTLELFFGGWLPHLMRSRFPDCYSVYAGGDDLFMVGPWDQTLELGTAINADFARLAQNPALHLSAGVLLAKPGYPIARAAADASEALDTAKEAGRDRIHVLGHTLTWA